MRRTLALALLLLLLAGLREWSARVGEVGTPEFTAHRMFSTGLGLRGVRRVRPEGLGAIWVGRQWFVPRDGALGLRAAATTLDGEVIDFFNYDLRRGADLELFEEHCRARQVGTVLSLALRGSMRPGDPEQAERLERICRGLGASAAPVEFETASWAFTARRGREGWVPLGEAFSATSGVVLTVDSAEGCDPLRLIEPAPGGVVSWVARLAGREPGRVRRGWSLAHATCDGLRFAFGPTPRNQAPGRGAERPFELDVDLGPRPRFECTLVLMPRWSVDEEAPDARAEFALRADGEVVARRVLTASQAEVDESWTVPLDSFAERGVRLELAVEARGAAWAAAAAPLVVFD